MTTFPPQLRLIDADTLFARLAAAHPAPETTLYYDSPFELLIAVMLSAQATDKRVNVATQVLFPQARTPEALLALGEEALQGYIRRIGLYRTKARNILKTCALLITRHGGQVPADRVALEALPGVGRKTANVVLNVAFGEPTIAVDTHVFRVARRIGLAHGRTPLAVEAELLAITPDVYRKNAHHWLIAHGRTICPARKPHCAHCPVRDLCVYPDKEPC